MDARGGLRGSQTSDTDDVMPKPYAVIIVDMCRLFREGLVQILRSSRFDVVSAAANIDDALTGGYQVGRLGAIDLLICGLDPQYAIEPQLEAIRAVRHRDAAARTVLLMPSCTPEDLVAAVLCGVDGVILKDISSETLIAALGLVMHGQHVLPLGVTLQVFTTLLPAAQGTEELRQEPAGTRLTADLADAPDAASPAMPDSGPADSPSVFEAADAASQRGRKPVGSARNIGLSDRETEILQYLVEGCANKLIARRLDIAEATVKVHVKGLLRKINVSNRTQAAIWALNRTVAERRVRNEMPPQQPVRDVGTLATSEALETGRLAEPLLSEMIAVFPPAFAKPPLPGHP